MNPSMKNIFSLGCLEKCNFVVQRGTASGARKKGPEPREDSAVAPAELGGGGRQWQLTQRRRGGGGTRWCFTAVCVLTEGPAADGRGVETFFSL